MPKWQRHDSSGLEVNSKKSFSERIDEYIFTHCMQLGSIQPYTSQNRPQFGILTHFIVAVQVHILQTLVFMKLCRTGFPKHEILASQWLSLEIHFLIEKTMNDHQIIYISISLPFHN